MVPAVAVNVAELAPAGTSTDEGTVRLELLLLSTTVAPPVPTAAVNDTEQLDVPGALIAVGLHARERKDTAGGARLMEVVAEPPLHVAVRVAVWAEEMVPAVAVNVADVEPAGTSTDEGTVRLELLLLSATVAPPVPAAALNDTEQLDVPGALIAVGLHVRERKDTAEPTLRVPPLAVTVRLVPVGDAANTLVSPMLTLPEEIEGVTLTVASTPFPIAVRFKPLAMHW
jgi:hypothetical protein